MYVHIKTTVQKHSKARALTPSHQQTQTFHALTIIIYMEDISTSQLSLKRL